MSIETDSSFKGWGAGYRFRDQAQREEVGRLLYRMVDREEMLPPHRDHVGSEPAGIFTFASFVACALIEDAKMAGAYGGIEHHDLGEVGTRLKALIDAARESPEAIDRWILAHSAPMGRA